MKSVTAAAMLLVLCIAFCAGCSSATREKLDVLITMTEELPQSLAEHRANAEICRKQIERITGMWADAMPQFSYLCGYTALNRADEAVWNLYASVGAEDAAAAVTARCQLLDALRRMRELEGISLQSVF